MPGSAPRCPAAPAISPFGAARFTPARTAAVFTSASTPVLVAAFVAFAAMPPAAAGSGAVSAGASTRAARSAGGAAGDATGGAAGGAAGGAYRASAAGLRMEISGVAAGTAWTTVYWTLTNVTGRTRRLPAALFGDRGTGRWPAGRTASGLRLISAPGRSAHHPLGGEGGVCLCTDVAGRSLRRGRTLPGFTTFPALPGHDATVRIDAPPFGSFHRVPVGRSAPGTPDDGTGFAAERIDRLPYATVLRVRKRPARLDPALARPVRLARSAGTPMAASEVTLVDPRTRTAYTPLYGPGRCMCADFTAGVERDGGVRGVYVFPHLPAVTRLRVWFTGGLPADDVPVTDVPPVPAGSGHRAAGASAWPRQVWPPPRPAAREVAAYGRSDRVEFRAVTDRPGTRREESGRRASTLVLFRFDSARLTPAARPALRELAREISRRTDIKGVRVGGYSDHTGGDGYNLRLSERRAGSVARFLDRLVTRDDVVFDVRAHGEARTGEQAGPDARPEPAALRRNATVVLPR